jgi:hypothetical protein
VARLREIGGQVGSAPACYGSYLGLNPDTLKITKRATKAKEWPTNCSPSKKIYKITMLQNRLEGRGERGEGCHPSDLLCWLTIIWSGQGFGSGSVSGSALIELLDPDPDPGGQK